jgi:trigger factor
MKVEIEHLSPICKKMSVALPPEIVNREVEKAYQKLQKNIKLRGFRPGKAPLALLEQYFKAQVEEDVIATLVQDTYPKALDETNVLPVSQPAIEKGILEKGREFSYTASFEIKPVVDARDYQGLELEKEKLQVTDEDVSEQLKSLQNSHATLKSIDGRLAQNGDCVIIDYEGTIEGKPFAGSSLKDHMLEIAADAFIPGFTDQLIGLQQGNEKRFSLDVPADYVRSDLAGKTIAFTVWLKEIKEKILPALDDEFARDLGDYKDLEDLKIKIRESLLAQKEQRIKEDVKQKLVSLLIAKNPFDVPQSMIENQIRTMLVNMQQRLSAQGIRPEDFSNSVDRLSEIYREPAERQVRSALLLESIAHKEGITVTDDAVETRYKEIADAVNQDVGAVKAALGKDSLSAQLLEDKTFDFLIAKSTIREI